MINENDVSKPILEIIDFNYPTPEAKERVYRGKTIFFERVFFKTLSHICQESLVHSDTSPLSAKLPGRVYITKYIPKLRVKKEHWEKIIQDTGFDVVENRNTWVKLVLEFTKYKFELGDKTRLPENIHLSTSQTILLILFCYFYYFNKDYAELSSYNGQFVLPEKTHITWALFEPGVISQFIAPLRKLSVFGQFDERDLPQFFKLSGNPLTSLRWILQPIYEERFLPVHRSVLSLDRALILSNDRFSLSALTVHQEEQVVINTSSPNISFLSLPQIDQENHHAIKQAPPDKQETISIGKTTNWEQSYYQKVREVQELRQQLIEKDDYVSNTELLSVFEELLRLPGEFEELFLKIVPNDRHNARMRKWRMRIKC